MILSVAMNRMEDSCIPIRPSEEMEEYDWHLDETDDEGYRVVVRADPLHECRSAEIVAVYIDRSCPVNYLMDLDGILYFVGKSSRVMDLYFPMTDYLKWRNSCRIPIYLPHGNSSLMLGPIPKQREYITVMKEPEAILRFLFSEDM